MASGLGRPGAESGAVAGGRGAGSVHSPLTRARGDRRSRSVRRLKVARLVTLSRGGHPPAPSPLVSTPVSTYINLVHNRIQKRF